MPTVCRQAAATDDALALALHGGEEYELLFTARPKPASSQGDRRSADHSYRRDRARAMQMRLANADGKTRRLKPGGWQHFGSLSRSKAHVHVDKYLRHRAR